MIRVLPLPLALIATLAIAGEPGDPYERLFRDMQRDSARAQEYRRYERRLDEHERRERWDRYDEERRERLYEEERDRRERYDEYERGDRFVDPWD